MYLNCFKTLAEIESSTFLTRRIPKLPAMQDHYIEAVFYNDFKGPQFPDFWSLSLPEEWTESPKNSFLSLLYLAFMLTNMDTKKLRI